MPGPSEMVKDDSQTLYCSFCGKSTKDVERLIAGPTVFICNECVVLCEDILDERLGRPSLRIQDPEMLKLLPKIKITSVEEILRLGGKSSGKMTALELLHAVIKGIEAAAAPLLAEAKRQAEISALNARIAGIEAEAAVELADRLKPLHDKRQDLLASRPKK